MVKFLLLSLDILSWKLVILNLIYVKKHPNLCKSKSQTSLVSVKYSHDLFEETDLSIDSILYKLAARYADDIARNDDYLRAIRIMTNMPIIVLLIGVMIAGYLIPSPKPFPPQPSPTQSSSSAPSQVKPGP